METNLLNKQTAITKNEEDTNVALVDEKSLLLLRRKKSPESHSSSRSPSPEPAGLAPVVNQQKTSNCKKFSIIVLLALLLWATFSLSSGLLETKKPKVIYASRYSREHKFRPAASPIITETLKDGRIRLRGAQPEPTPEPTPVAKPKKKRPNAGKLTGKRKATKQKGTAPTMSKR